MTARITGAAVVVTLAAGLVGCSAGTDAQSGGTPVPFKVGTFERGGQPFVGLVLARHAGRRHRAGQRRL